MKNVILTGLDQAVVVLSSFKCSTDSIMVPLGYPGSELPPKPKILLEFLSTLGSSAAPAQTYHSIFIEAD